MPKVQFPITIKLSKSYAGLDGDFNTLELREPKGLDFIENNMPIRQFSEKGSNYNEMRIDYALIFKWASVLSGVGVLILQHFNKADTQALMDAITTAIGDEDDDTEKNSEG